MRPTCPIDERCNDMRAPFPLTGRILAHSRLGAFPLRRIFPLSHYRGRRSRRRTRAAPSPRSIRVKSPAACAYSRSTCEYPARTHGGAARVLTGTHGYSRVLTGYSQGTRGYSRGTHGVLTGTPGGAARVLLPRHCARPCKALRSRVLPAALVGQYSRAVLTGTHEYSKRQ